MGLEIAELGIELTPYAIPPLLTAAVLAVLAALIFITERGTRSGVAFVFWASALFFWLLFHGLSLSTADPARALAWSHVSQAGASFIPLTIIHFSQVLQAERLRQDKWLWAGWGISFVFVTLLFISPLYISGTYKYDWGYYPAYGIIGYVFFAYFVLYYTMGFYNLIRGYRHAPVNGLAKRRMLTLIILFMIVSFGVLDFLPNFGIDYYPMGWLPVLIFIIGIYYVITRYRIVDVAQSYADRQIVDSMRDGLLILDQDKIVRLANTAVSVVLGSHHEIHTGRGIMNALKAPIVEQQIAEMIEHEEVAQRQIDYDNPVKGARVLELTLTPMWDARGVASAHMIFIEDITGRARTQSELEQRVKQRTAELALMRDQALEASRTKSTFLANMSHELRTPLNAIIGYSEMLIEDDEELDRIERIHDLEKIRASGTHLLKLINSILDLSKIEAGKMEIYREEVVLADLVEDVVATARPLVEAQHNKLVVNIEDSIRIITTDSIKLKQILLNLLSNAAKFTEYGTINLYVDQEIINGVPSVCFRVSDTGIGMSAKQMGGLFRDFSQVHSIKDISHGGTGLGLVISRRFSNLLGGDILVTSSPGKGSAFIVVFPFDALQGEEPTPALMS